MFGNFLSFAFPQTLQQKISKTLESLQLNTNQALPQNYQNLIYISHENFSQSFATVINHLPKASTPSAIIKIFTLILRGIRNKQCSIEILQNLQQLQTPLISQIQQKDISWINQITIAIKSYLARLPSLYDAFQRATQIKKQKQNKNYQVYLSDLYLMLNASALLFPAVTNCMNNIGRYYFKTYLYFTQFYKAIKDQILIGYQYIEYIISIFKYHYKEYDLTQLECFMKTISEIELYCDRVEEFTMNKYFRGKGPVKKIYFKEEEINEINYYIHSSKIKNTSSDTNDQEVFGDFQQ